MKKIIKGSMAVMLSALICAVFVGCSKTDSNEVTQTNAITTKAVETTKSAPKEYAYNVTGMQNAVVGYGTEKLIIEEGDESDYHIYVKVTCPICNGVLTESATLPKSNIGDATYVYAGEAVCMNNHPDKNTTGYFYNFSAMFALENNE